MEPGKQIMSFLAISLSLVLLVSACSNGKPGGDTGPVDVTTKAPFLTESSINRALDSILSIVPEDTLRPAFHLLPPAGFMGDPNGGIWKDDWYHIFYLHNPFSGNTGNWYWAHARSRDLLKWEHIWPGILPPHEMNVHNLISGSTLLKADGTPMAFYSAPDAEGMKFWSAAGSKDLLHWEHRGELSGLSLSQDGLPDFDRSWRDPFVFSTNGRTFMLVCADIFDESYVPLPIFEADNEDLSSWTYKGLLFTYSKNRLRNLEVPELRQVGDKWVLLVSCDAPLDMTYHFVGDLDLDELKFTPTSEGPLDYSPHYYAQESIEDEQGNLYLMAWLSGWDREWMPNFKEEDRKNTHDWWNGSFALPRQLQLDADGELMQQPVESLKKLREKHVRLEEEFLEIKNVLTSNKVLEEVRGNQLELDLELDLGTASFVGLNVLCDENGQGGLSVMWSGNMVIVDEIRIPVKEWKPGDPVRLQVFVDKMYVEIFINEGKYCITRKVKERNITGDHVSLVWLSGNAKLNHLDAWQLKDLNKLN